MPTKTAGRRSGGSRNGTGPRVNGSGPASAGSTRAAGSLNEIGMTGLIRYSGYIFEEFLPQLLGKRAIQVYKEMRYNDPIVGAILFAIDNLVRQVKWRVEAASESSEDEDAKEFLDQCMNDMSHSWEEMISEILSMLWYGWSYHEIVYKKRMGSSKNPKNNSKFNDGKIGWRKIPIRAQETLLWWEFDDDGGIQGMLQQPPPTFEEIFIPIQKSLLFRTSTYKNNPEGRSFLRNAYRPWFFKKKFEEVEAIGVERDLCGLPMMYVDPKLLVPNPSPDDVKTLRTYQQMIINIRRDQQEGVLLPMIYDDEGNQLYKLELLSSAGARQFNIGDIIQRKNQEIAMTVLADFIFLGHEQNGSWALSSDKTNLFAVALGAVMDMIKAVFNEYAVPRLFALNGFDSEQLPKITYGDIESPDLSELAQYLTALSNAGVPLFPNDNLVRRLLEVANLPAPPEGQEIQYNLQEPQTQPEGGAATGPGTNPKKSTNDAKADQDKINQLSGRAAQKGAKKTQASKTGPGRATPGAGTKKSGTAARSRAAKKG